VGKFVGKNLSVRMLLLQPRVLGFGLLQDEDIGSVSFQTATRITCRHRSRPTFRSSKNAVVPAFFVNVVEMRSSLQSSRV
jgi:hypothetical protein